MEINNRYMKPLIGMIIMLACTTYVDAMQQVAQKRADESSDKQAATKPAKKRRLVIADDPSLEDIAPANGHAAQLEVDSAEKLQKVREKLKEINKESVLDDLDKPGFNPNAFLTGSRNYTITSCCDE